MKSVAAKMPLEQFANRFVVTVTSLTSLTKSYPSLQQSPVNSPMAELTDCGAKLRS